MGSIAYDRENTLQIKFKFNLRTDADIIEHLNSIENRQGYIKQLIRADIAAQTGTQAPTTSEKEIAIMNSIHIYEAGIRETLTNGEYQMGEINTCENGEEWQGDVRGYVENLMCGDEYELRSEEELGRVHQNFGGLDPIPGSIVLLFLDGEPREIYWASSQSGE